MPTNLVGKMRSGLNVDLDGVPGDIIQLYRKVP